MALGAIGEDDEIIREIEKMREFERMKGLGSEEKKKGREIFIETKKEELWRM